ncbi:MAG: hypothetical protein KDD44_06285, partial [Bdellovibrionales bacterium]|nr:hypothetical protein [Bdellovibrionales bacterium]
MSNVGPLGRSLPTNGSLTATPVVSVVIPFFNKHLEFEHALSFNAGYLAKPSVEVVLVLDEPFSWEHVRRLIARYATIRWHVLVHDEMHRWRNPAPVINVGLRRARGRFVLVVSPETVFLGDVPEIFLATHSALSQERLSAYGNPDVALFGMVQFLRFGEQPEERRSVQKPYGSIFFERQHGLRLHGYNERFVEWGGDDDEFRRRLTLSDVAVVGCPQARLAHFETEQDYLLRRSRDESRILRQKYAVNCIHDWNIDQPEFGALECRTLVDWAECDDLRPVGSLISL